MPTNTLKIAIIFGKMGSGKSTCGEEFKKLGYQFYEGDNDVPKAMKEKADKFEVPGLQDIDELVTNLINGVSKQLQENKSVVVSQALYLNPHRLRLLDTFSKKYDVAFYYVDTPEKTQRENLRTRKDGEKWVEYAKLNDPYFQLPDSRLNAKIIHNSGGLSDLCKEIESVTTSTTPTTQPVTPSTHRLFATDKQSTVIANSIITTYASSISQ